jgi:hypothetical protein
VSESALKQLVGALAVVVAVWLVSMVFRAGSGSIAATGEMADFFDGVGRETLEGVRVERAEDPSVTLSRVDGGWTVNGFRADTAAVDRMLSALDEAQIGELIAANPANHDRMGVSADSAYTVTFSVEGGDRTLLVGKSARRFGTAYVRLPDADEVYLMDADLRPQLSRDVESWRDRTMVAIDTASVARIVVERDGGAYALVRGDSAWTFDGGGATTQSAVGGVLSELARMMATGFLEEGDSLAVLEQASTTTAITADGEVLVAVTLGAGEGDRWARSSTSQYLYRVSSFRAGRVAPARESVELGS